MSAKVRVLEPLESISYGRQVFIDLKPGQLVDMPEPLVERLLKLKKVARINNLVEPDVQDFLESTVRSTTASIEVKRASEVYGENAIEPDRETVVILTENGARLVAGLPRGVRFEDGKWIVTEKEAAKKFLKNQASKFGGFLRKYGRWPHVGDDVDTLVNGNGIARICIAEVEKPNGTAVEKKTASSQRKPCRSDARGRGNERQGERPTQKKHPSRPAS